jgi:hypothetical protein
MSAHPPVLDVLPRHTIPKEPPRVKITAKEPKKTQGIKENPDDKETTERKGIQIHVFVRLHKLNIKKMRLLMVLTMAPKRSTVTKSPTVTKQTSLPFSVA